MNNINNSYLKEFFINRFEKIRGLLNYLSKLFTPQIMNKIKEFGLMILKNFGLVCLLGCLPKGSCNKCKGNLITCYMCDGHGKYWHDSLYIPSGRYVSCGSCWGRGKRKCSCGFFTPIVALFILALCCKNIADLF